MGIVSYNMIGATTALIYLHLRPILLFCVLLYVVGYYMYIVNDEINIFFYITCCIIKKLLLYQLPLVYPAFLCLLSPLLLCCCYLYCSYTYTLSLYNLLVDDMYNDNLSYS